MQSYAVEPINNSYNILSILLLQEIKFVIINVKYSAIA